MSSSAALPEGDPRPLRDQVRDQLRAWIVDGRLAPGTPVSERELAEQFGVSRVPVREAIRMLDVEGFITTRAGRGSVVRSLSRDDVEELFAVREALEVLEARLAAVHAGPAEARRLRWLLDEARHTIDAGDHVQLTDLNAQFHDEISSIAKNRTLAATLRPLAGRLRWNVAQNADPERIWREHEELVSAIVAGDADRAGTTAAAHVQSRRQVLLDNLPGS